jgi:hypothetical protein
MIPKAAKGPINPRKYDSKEPIISPAMFPKAKNGLNGLVYLQQILRVLQLAPDLTCSAQ